MVEDFWGVLNNVRPPSRLNPGSNYHLFKSGIEPMWEHTANQAGGKWTYNIPKKDGKKLIDDMWLYTVSPPSSPPPPPPSLLPLLPPDPSRSPPSHGTDLPQ